MKIFILGTGKSGTTALVYKVAGGLPNCHAFSGGQPGKYIGDYENAVYKQTYSERKGRTLDAYREHATEIDYDRKIWMAAILEMLQSVECSSDGTRATWDTGSNTENTSNWSRGRSRILHPSPFTSFSVTSDKIAGP